MLNLLRISLLICLSLSLLDCAFSRLGNAESDVRTLLKEGDGRFISRMLAAQDDVKNYSIDTKTPSYAVVGCIGYFIYLPLLIASLSRTYSTFKFCDDAVKYYAHKKVFHVFLSLYYFCEWVYMIVQWDTGIDANNLLNGGYRMHLFALVFNLWAFCVVVNFWMITLFPRSLSNTIVGGIMLLACVFVFVIACVLIGYADYYHSPECDSGDCLNVYLTYVATNSFFLFLTSVFFLSVLVKLQCKLLSFFGAGYGADSSSEGNATSKRNMDIVIRITRVAFCIVVFYFWRALIDAYIFSDEVKPGTTRATLGLLSTDQLLWFLFTKWIPIIIPSICMLNLMRPRKLLLQEFCTKALQYFGCSRIGNKADNDASSNASENDGKNKKSVPLIFTSTAHADGQRATEDKYDDVNVSVDLSPDLPPDRAGTETDVDYARWSGYSIGDGDISDFGFNPSHSHIQRFSIRDLRNSRASSRSSSTSEVANPLGIVRREL